MAKRDCWDEMGCGHGPDAEDGDICAAAKAAAIDGVNRGHNGGRACWAVRGTCGTAESVNDKLPGCVSCRFFRLVQDEEGRGFVLLEGLLRRLGEEVG